MAKKGSDMDATGLDNSQAVNIESNGDCVNGYHSDQNENEKNEDLNEEEEEEEEEEDVAEMEEEADDIDEIIDGENSDCDLENSDEQREQHDDEEQQQEQQHNDEDDEVEEMDDEDDQQQHTQEENVHNGSDAGDVDEEEEEEDCEIMFISKENSDVKIENGKNTSKENNDNNDENKISKENKSDIVKVKNENEKINKEKLEKRKRVFVEDTEIPDEECGFPEYLKGNVIRGKCIPINKRTWKEINIDGNDAILDCASQVVPLMIKKPDVFPLKLPREEDEGNDENKKLKKQKKDNNSDDENDDGIKFDHDKNENNNNSNQTKIDADEDDEGGVEVQDSTEASNEGSLNEQQRLDNLRSLLTISDYNSSSIGKFLIGIGLSRAKEFLHKDNIRHLQKRKRKYGEDDDDVVDELKKQQSYLAQCKAANSVFVFEQRKCHMCDFKTESESVLDGHYHYPHLVNRKEYKCNYCLFTSRDAQAIMQHFQLIHRKRCLLETAPATHECPNCSYESNHKAKAMTHFARCVKTFDPNRVCFQQEVESELPAITPKPITQADITVYEDVLANFRSILSSGSLRQPLEFIPGLPRGLQYQMFLQQQQLAQRSANNRSTQFKNFENNIQALGNEIYTQAMKQQQLMFQQQQQLHQQQKQLEAASLQSLKNRIVPAGASVTIPRSLVNLNKINVFGKGTPGNETLANKSSTFVICEICDGYIKDLEQLRTHMQWIHKVKIHPKMLASRPPLNCQKCQWRFFTDQGLERHLLGAHGLVTSNMQDLVDQNFDGGRCTICGRVFANKLVSHMNQVHKITLRPAHLSYKCTVCSATFNLYRLFENHVYMVHSGSMKRNNSLNSDCIEADRL